MTDGYSDESSVTPRRRLADISTAFAHVEAAKTQGHQGETEAARQVLQTAIDDARDADIPWGAIGDVLGLTRGNAYQRYRRRSAR
jgi:hypothetical protein